MKIRKGIKLLLATVMVMLLVGCLLFRHPSPIIENGSISSPKIEIKIHPSPAEIKKADGIFKIRTSVNVKTKDREVESQPVTKTEILDENGVVVAQHTDNDSTKVKISDDGQIQIVTEEPIATYIKDSKFKVVLSHQFEFGMSYELYDFKVLNRPFNVEISGMTTLASKKQGGLVTLNLTTEFSKNLDLYAGVGTGVSTSGQVVYRLVFEKSLK